MPEIIEPQEQDSKADRNRIARVNRNRRIRDAYYGTDEEDGMCDRYGRQEAWKRLGERHGLSPSTVRDIVYGQR